MIQRLYMDYNATQPLRPAVYRAMLSIMQDLFNPSSLHQEGRQAHGLLEEARTSLAHNIDCQESILTFTSGASEANNLAIHSFCATYPHGSLLVDAGAHPSLRTTALRQPIPAQEIGLDHQGRLKLEDIQRGLETLPAPCLVAMTLANSETGVLNFPQHLAPLIKSKQGFLLCDAVQALDKMPLSFKELGVDFLTLSSHKIGGPPGIGLLISPQNHTIAALHLGGAQENYRRAGTPFVAGAIGFAKALNIACSSFKERKHLGPLRDMFEHELTQICPEIIFLGQQTPRTNNTSCFVLPPQYPSSDVVFMTLDLNGLALSRGSACTSRSAKPSHVLKAMGLNDDQASRALRISLGPPHNKEDINHALRVFQQTLEAYLQI